MEKSGKEKKMMVGNLKGLIIALSFLFWLGVSITQPVIRIFNNPDIFDYVVIFNNFFIIIALATMVIPQLRKKKGLKNLDLKVGNTKKGCRSCKKKKK